MRMINSIKKLQIIATFLLCLTLITYTTVQGADLSNWTFGVEKGDTNAYIISVVNYLDSDGVLRKELQPIYSYYFGPATEPTVIFTEGDSLIACITDIINGSLLYELKLLKKDGSNITSSNISYNQPSDITLPLQYHLISSINKTQLNFTVETTYHNLLSVEFSNDLIKLRSSPGNCIYEADYDIITGWAKRLYAKCRNETHLIYELEIVDETLATTSMNVSWIPLTIWIPLIPIVFGSKRFLFQYLEKK